MEILRAPELALLRRRLEAFPVVAILGPRQCGKTTLAHQFERKQRAEIHFFDMEDPRDLAQLDQPILALEGLSGYVVIDEIQRRSDLFPVLRVLVDQHKGAKFIILGSASRDLIQQSSETLAGRISYVEMGGFTLAILSSKNWKRLWLRGGFPRSYLSKDDAISFQWRMDFVTNFLERDIPNLGIRIPPRALHRFWLMLAHYHGQILNASELGRSFGVADTTVRHYLDIFTGTFVLRQIQPWFYNTKKRLIKRPKIYFRDSGIFHTLLSIETYDDLVTNPKLGASFEGYALEQVIYYLGLREEEVFFWGTHTGGELDLVFSRGGKLWGVEVKYGEAPTLTTSMQQALSELSLAHLWVIYPGKVRYQLEKNITVVPLTDLVSIVKSIAGR